MKTLSEIRPIKESTEAELLKKPGVTGVSIGPKIVGGKKTDELAIRVYVAKKKKEKELSREELIPKKIGDVVTDVIERTYVLHPARIKLEDLKIMADTGRYDTLVGGISIGPCRVIDGYVYTGTLGAIVKDNATENFMLLSNFHVMCVDDSHSVGDKMAQPSRVDTGRCPADEVGELERSSLGGQVDCAICTVMGRSVSPKIQDIGDVLGTATASVGIAVRKRGRTTGLTYGEVVSLDLSVSIDYGDGLGDRILTNQIEIEADTTKSAQFGNHGDSGSVVVNANNRIIGLYFAGDDTGSVGVANPIQSVLDALNISIYQKFAVKPPKETGGKNWHKDTKDIKQEFKEIKDQKSEGKEIKDIRDTYPRAFEIPGPGPIGQPTGTLEDRLANLECLILGSTGRETFSTQAKATEVKNQEKLNEYKYRAREKFAIKDMKDTKPEHKELTDTYTKAIEVPGPGPIGQPTGSLEDRLANLEAAVGLMTHFIGQELRPDLDLGALNREPDLNPAEMQALSQQLMKQASDAKRTKDNKDVEKLHER